MIQSHCNFRQNFDSKNIDYKKSKYDVLDDSDCLVLITEWKEFRALDLDELAKDKPEDYF